MIKVIVPVYCGLDDTKKCLEAVLGTRGANKTPFKVVAINDRSPDPEITELLRTYARKGELELIEHEDNAGFVKSVNEGMRLDVSNDVVLLNSDAIVANDWLDRMHRCAYSAKDIGTVTPFSNNATICSFPDFCQENELLAGFSVAEIDRAFAKANASGVVEIPTAVGFCMYIRRDCLDQVGVFDEETFGRGYGEENDFCRRAVKQKWRNVLCADTFVAHIGGVSFSGEKAARVENAQRQLDRLHPEYHQCVQEHIHADPARPYRMRAMAAIISASAKPKVLFVSHHLGGGVEHHVEELAAHLGELAHFLVLRKSANPHSFELCFHESTDDRLHFNIPEEFSELVSVLKDLGVSLVHYHHTLEVHPDLLSLPAKLAVPHDFTIHDYYLINANPTLTDNTGRYCDERETRDEKCLTHYRIPGEMAAEVWRNIHRKFLENCRHVYAPTKYVADLFASYYPEAKPIVAYHTDCDRYAPYPEPKPWAYPLQRPLRVVVIGAISREKGADVLERTAMLASEKSAALEFHLLGYAYRPLDEAVVTHGSYHQSELDTKLRDIAPDIIWLPARWPETYSYTLSEALRNGYPVVVPDIGAFPERVKNRPYSWVEYWDNSPGQWLEVFQRLLSTEGGISADSATWNHENPYNYEREYLTGIAAVEAYCSDTGLDRMVGHLKVKSTEGNLSEKERMLLLILKFRSYRPIGFLMRYIPYNFQRRVKRWFSSKPLHLIKR